MCEDHHSTLTTTEPIQVKDDDVFIKAYNKAKRKSVVISTALDDDIRNCIRNSIRKSKCTPGMINESLNPILAKIEEYEQKVELQQMSSLKKKKNSLDLNRSTYSNKPRFGSLLSKDGQYALLKTYEDLIVNELQTLYPELKDHIQRTHTARFKETRSRHSSTSTTASNATSTSSVSASGELFDSNRSLNTNSHNDIYTMPLNTCHNPNNSSVGRHRNSDSLIASSSFFDFNEINYQLELEKKLKITRQLENAMEIIDNLRLMRDFKRKGSLDENQLTSFSSNAGGTFSEEFDALDKYNKWRNVWMEIIEIN